MNKKTKIYTLISLISIIYSCLNIAKNFGVKKNVNNIDDDSEEVKKQHEIEENNKQFFSYTTHIFSLRQSNREKHDAAILTLSSAILGGSIAILKDTIINKNIGWILVVSWLLFTLAIIFLLISFLHGNFEAKETINNAREFFSIDCDQDNYIWKNRFSIRIESFTIASSISFMIALILLVVFVSISFLEKGSKMSNSSSDGQKGLSSPPPPRAPSSSPSSSQSPPPSAPKGGNSGGKK